MPLVEANWKPNHRQLKQFGSICAIAMPLIGWLWSATAPVIAGLAIVGLAIAALAFTFPRSVAPLFIGLSLLTLPIGLVIGELTLFIIYVGVFLPIGVVFKLMHRDRLQTQFDRNAKTYWQEKPQPASVASYYRQS